MKKLIVVFLTFCLFTININYSLAQTDFDDANKQYLDALEKYSRLHEEYIIAKSTYLQFQTIIAKEEAINKTQDYLNQVATVIESYLNLFKVRINVALGAEINAKEKLFSEIDKELIWLSQFKESVNQTSTLRGLEEKANILNGRYKALKKIIKKQTLLLKLYENRSIKEYLSDVVLSLDNQVIAAAQSGRNAVILQRALEDINDKLNTVKAKLDKAINKILIENRDYGAQGVVDEVRVILSSTIPIAREIIRGLI